MTNIDPAKQKYVERRRALWDAIAVKLDSWAGWGGYYHERLAEVYRFLVPPGLRVLEVGCGRGDLLAAAAPSAGLGIDFSSEMISRARARHPDLRFEVAEACEFAPEEKFDVIILSDILNEVWDVQSLFERLAASSHAGTRVIVNSYSRLWEMPLSLAHRLDVANPAVDQNWLTVEDVANMFDLAGFSVLRAWPEIVMPLKVPLVTALFNRYLARLWPFRVAALTNFVVARPHPRRIAAGDEPTVSVVVPARNEAGNIRRIFERVPRMGAGTELVFVEGHSTDDTYGAIEAEMKSRPDVKCQLHRQTGKGKGDAVRLGFEKAAGDLLMILDADLTVPPEDLPRFYEVIASGKGDFVNGVRLVYPMEEKAMRFLNLVGNKFFSKAFSWLLGQPIKDTLCGTKALLKKHYEQIAANRPYFGDFDPFGDFDLLFGAARQNLKIVEMPVRYRERTYGETNISRFAHGWLLLKMVVFAMRRIKFV